MALPGKTLYTGSYRHNLDDKGRLTIPSAWRAAHAEGEQFLAVPNPGGYISELSPAKEQKMHEKGGAGPHSDTQARDQIAAFFAVAQGFTFDKQGRIALNPELLQRAGISKESVLSGSMNTFSIYSPERWAAITSRTSEASQADFLRRYGI